MMSEVSGAAQVPDARGYYGEYGGRFVPETLIPALDELTEAFHAAMADPAFVARFEHLQATYTGRPTPLTYAEQLSKHLGGARIYLKREDLAHTGAHKINNALGQALLAERMGKRRIIAETGAGSTASRRPRRRRCWGWSATSTWARWTSPARSRTCSA